jgi:Ca2+-binding RTX toxin-like protein
MSKLTRTIPAAILAATALMAAPSGAGAAAQVGQTVDPAGSFCSPNNLTWLQSISPSNGSFVVPFDGVITSWSYQGGAFPPAQLKLKVGRVGATSLTIVGESSPANPVANQLNTFPTKVTAHDDDVIGFLTTNGQCAALGQVGYAAVFANGDIPPPGGTGSPITTETGTHLDLSALLESDCDKDGLGDETQDQDLSSCGPGNPPGNPPGIPPATGPGTQAQATCKGLAATIVGTNGSDVRTGSLAKDVIAGLGGNDTLSGIAGNDVICGGGGKDLLKGGKGNDKLYGQKGNDALKGGGGNDVCKGGKGKDTLSSC